MDPHAAFDLVAQDGLATTRDLARVGLGRSALTRAVAAGDLVRVRPAVYALAPLPPLPEHLVVDGRPSAELVLAVRAVQLSLGRSAVPTGTTAGMLRGWALLQEPRRLEMGVRHGRSRARAPGMRCRQQRGLLAGPVEVGSGVLRLPPAWHSAIIGALDLELLDAVVLVDSALRAKDVSLPQLVRRAAALPGRTDSATVRTVLALCDPRAGSVLESVLRVRMLQDGIDGFTTQEVITRAGSYVLRADFCFTAARLVVEVDGSRWHPDREKDRRTDNALAAAGYRVLRFTWAEVVHGTEAVLAQIRLALGSSTSTSALVGS